MTKKKTATETPVEVPPLAVADLGIVAAGQRQARQEPVLEAVAHEAPRQL